MGDLVNKTKGSSTEILLDNFISSKTKIEHFHNIKIQYTPKSYNARVHSLTKFALERKASTICPDSILANFLNIFKVSHE